jgi:hypothetical protein
VLPKNILKGFFKHAVSVTALMVLKMLCCLVVEKKAAKI